MDTQPKAKPQSRKQARDSAKRSLLLKELDKYLTELSALHTTTEGVLTKLDPDVTQLRDALSDFENKLSLASQAAALSGNGKGGKRYNIPGIIQLRFLLDDDMPVFSKVDHQIMLDYRKRLQQYYHPDKPTGNIDMFNKVSAAYATGNLELLALLYSYISGSDVGLAAGSGLDIPSLHHYVGAAFRKLTLAKNSNTHRIARAYLASSNKTVAAKMLEDLIRIRATTMRSINLAV